MAAPIEIAEKIGIDVPALRSVYAAVRLLGDRLAASR
jgi:hypothetical protein